MGRCKEPAKVRHADILLHNGAVNLVMLSLEFDFGGSCQGLGYIVDAEFIGRMIRACSAERLSQCVGQVVLVDHDWSKVYGVEPMPFDAQAGEPFSIEAWAAAIEESRRTLRCPKCKQTGTAYHRQYHPLDATTDGRYIQQFDLQHFHLSCPAPCNYSGPLWQWIDCGHHVAPHPE